MIDSKAKESLNQLVHSETVSNITIEDFNIKINVTAAKADVVIKSKYDGILAKFSNVTDFQASEINTLKTLKLLDRTDDELANWIPGEDENCWKTPFREDEVYIQEYNGDPWEWRVNTPINKFRYHTNHRHPADAELVMFYYLYNENPWRIDYQKTLEEVAIEEFQKIDGIGSSTARDIASTKDIYSFEELKEKPFLIDTQYREEALADIQSRIDCGEQIKNHKKLSKLKSERAIQEIE
jgi:hypothetical protein